MAGFGKQISNFTRNSMNQDSTGFTCPIHSITTTGDYTTIYKFDSSGRTTDSGNGGKTLFNVGTPEYSNIDGKFGDYLICNGSNGLLSTEMPIGYTKYSAACWFNPKARLSLHNTAGLIGRYSASTPYGGFYIDIANIAGTMKLASLFAPAGTSNYLSYTFSTFALDTWFHVAATFDNGVHKLYLNGIEVLSNTTAGFTINNSIDRDFVIGYQNFLGSDILFFNGWIDEVVLVGNGVLTPTEIDILSKCPPIMFTCPIPSITTTGAYTSIYKFESSGRTTDSGNGGYTLSNLGTPVYSGTDGKFGDYLVCQTSRGLRSATIPIGYNKYSAAFWFNPKSSISSGRIAGLLGKSTGFQIFIQNDADTMKLTSRFASLTDSNQVYHTFSTFAADTWFHLATTYDNGVNKIYLNGIEVATNTTPGFIINDVSTHFTIGYHYLDYSNTRFFNGWIDEVVLVGDAVLSASEIDILSKCPPSI